MISGQTVVALWTSYPNAGLPNPLAPTGFDHAPADMAEQVGAYGRAGLVNIAAAVAATPRITSQPSRPVWRIFHLG